MDIQTLKAKRRPTTGSADARRIRRSGKVPGVLYGHGEEVIPLALTAEAIHELMEIGHHVVALDMDGSRQRALVKEVQFDTWGKRILHVDFSRVALDETVTVTVQIVSHGQPKAVLTDGLLEQPLHSLDVECTAGNIPDEIRVEIGEMEIGDTVHVRDLELPGGVKAVADPEAIVFALKEARAEEAVEEAAPEAEAAEAEPEVIGRAAKPEDEETAEESKET